MRSTRPAATAESCCHSGSASISSGDAHLLIGDEAPLPAIASALEVLPSGARAFVLLEGRLRERRALPRHRRRAVEVRWLHERSTTTTPSSTRPEPSTSRTVGCTRSCTANC
jgi:NADPH-dependent ferric siderophore reductase